MHSRGKNLEHRADAGSPAPLISLRSTGGVDNDLVNGSNVLSKLNAREVREQAGRALREKVGRAAHSFWKHPEGRQDPIATLQAADIDRIPELVPIRYGRMLQSPFAFYRGTAAIMAADLVATPSTGISVQACGDCHLANFGGFATPERNIIFDINDFDETLVGPWEWDVKRLATSFVLAARVNGHTESDARETAIACAHAYRKHLARYSKMHPIDVWYSHITAENLFDLAHERGRMKKRVKEANRQHGSEVEMLKITNVVGGKLRIHDMPPLIFHPKAASASEFDETVRETFRAYSASLSDERKTLLEWYELVDAAMKVVGVGSVGRHCWIVLLMSASNDPLFLQFKEAAPSCLEAYIGKSGFSHHGQRVVMGQRLIQPASDMFLGWVTASVSGRQYYVRQLRDVKIKPLVEQFDTELLLSYAEACGWALALAHARSGDPAAISGYLGSSDEFDEAIGKFSAFYADQTEKDFAALKTAVHRGRIPADLEN
ncbi:DUF2252 domain-containing protein (plasmid) [Ensifer sp. PDNC004]|nr:DUF2252 domain-containing protein [Ensifer sp. PDNC004]